MGQVVWWWSLGSKAFPGLCSPFPFPLSNCAVFPRQTACTVPTGHSVSLSVVRPFRKVNEKGVLLWDKIHKLQKGQIYKQVPRD